MGVFFDGIGPKARACAPRARCCSLSHAHAHIFPLSCSLPLPLSLSLSLSRPLSRSIALLLALCIQLFVSPSRACLLTRAPAPPGRARRDQSRRHLFRLRRCKLHPPEQVAPKLHLPTPHTLSLPPPPPPPLPSPRGGATPPPPAASNNGARRGRSCGTSRRHDAEAGPSEVMTPVMTLRRGQDRAADRARRDARARRQRRSCQAS